MVFFAATTNPEADGGSVSGVLKPRLLDEHGNPVVRMLIGFDLLKKWPWSGNPWRPARGDGGSLMLRKPLQAGGRVLVLNGMLSWHKEAMKIVDEWASADWLAGSKPSVEQHGDFNRVVTKLCVPDAKGDAACVPHCEEGQEQGAAAAITAAAFSHSASTVFAWGDIIVDLRSRRS